ncbi:MAG: hypothetical protein ABIO49_11520 [Dokdonella sp.]
MFTLHPLFAASLLVAALSAAAATYTVTRSEDPAPNGCAAGDCSLREALAAAVTTPAGDTIVLAAGEYTVTRGELSVVGEISIEGGGADDTRIVGNGNFDLLQMTPLGVLVLDGVMLSSQGAAVDVDSATATLRGVRFALRGERPDGKPTPSSEPVRQCDGYCGVAPKRFGAELPAMKPLKTRATSPPTAGTRLIRIHHADLSTSCQRLAWIARAGHSSRRLATIIAMLLPPPAAAGSVALMTLMTPMAANPPNSSTDTRTNPQ